MASVPLSQEELVSAFNQYMPKRPVYPPLVDDGESLENSATESEGSDDECEMKKKMKVAITLSAVMTPECQKSWMSASCKLPKTYLENNIKTDLEFVLAKLVNLKMKPANPIEWLGYALLNRKIMKPGLKTEDHKVKPVGGQLDFKIEADFNPYYIWREVSLDSYESEMNYSVTGRKRKRSTEPQ
ncbi:Protein CBG14692 [Caenorhabditis briggsae]|uniref:Uncharacterized protein n=2 Tax=Caenorhabditis briggsae TaxID=6238 RepID=A0AAE9CUS2_CAEBR|nr:Protein CBG14692 [Caenorhabditis briggsae]ULT82444.1 hypothetical protein L3Y34_012011 [Caenorhabditis briggsae]UMM41744.1 hypothetical protein L5515_017870 [Caenorhabditis briggsae]CAP33142.1 Protein CBG14692 [Caenorhabditis briggsae]